MLPSSNWVAADMTGIMNKFCILENEFRAINELTRQSAATNEEILRNVVNSSKILSTSFSLPPRSGNTPTSDEGRIHALNRTTLSHPHTYVRAPQKAPGAWLPLVGSQEMTTDEEGDFSVVVSRKRQRMLTSEHSASQQVAASTAVKTPVIKTTKRTLRMIGTSTASSTSLLLKAAKDLTRNEVFYISNAHIDNDCATMTSFVNSLSVRVLSCFVTKTRFMNSKAFRICINKDDRRAFLNKEHWSCNISVRSWSFKSKPTDTTEDQNDNVMSTDTFLDCQTNLHPNNQPPSGAVTSDDTVTIS